MPDTPQFVIDTIHSVWKPGEKIVEIGCGPGFLRRHFGGDYVGTDISDAPYKLDLPRNVDCVCTAGELSIRNEAIDIVVVKSALYLFADHSGALLEAHRVLKTGGAILIFDYNRRTQKIMQRKEGHTNYPCWTQWALRKLVLNTNFKRVELLAPKSHQPNSLQGVLRRIHQELFGNWAIVRGFKE
jgi:ubiquinone/menaquinone biosynthesis C-methylase UbiE